MGGRRKGGGIIRWREGEQQGGRRPPAGWGMGRRGEERRRWPLGFTAKSASVGGKKSGLDIHKMIPEKFTFSHLGLKKLCSRWPRHGSVLFHAVPYQAGTGTAGTNGPANLGYTLESLDPFV